MSVIAHPQRLCTPFQFDGPLRLDTADPLADKLLEAWYFNGVPGSVPRELLTGRVPAQFVTGLTPTVPRFSLGHRGRTALLPTTPATAVILNNPGTGNFARTGILSSTSWTVASRVTPLSTTGITTTGMVVGEWSVTTAASAAWGIGLRDPNNFSYSPSFWIHPVGSSATYFSQYSIYSTNFNWSPGDTLSLMFTRQGNRYTAYVNGYFYLATGLGLVSSALTSTGTTGTLLGAAGGSGGDRLNAEIDYYYAWTRALTAVDAARLHYNPASFMLRA